MLLLIILPILIPHAFAEEDNTNIQPQSIVNKIFETTPTEGHTYLKLENGTYNQKLTRIPNGDRFWINRFEFASNKKELYRFSFKIPGKNGTFTYVENTKDGRKRWRKLPLTGKLPKAVGFIDTDKHHMLMSYATTYKTLDHASVKEVYPKSSAIHVAENEDGYTLVVYLPQEKSLFSEFWGLESDSVLVDWNEPNMSHIWLLLDLYYQRKWSWDGIYEKSPSSYTPSGDHIYYRFADNHVARSFVLTGGSRAADVFGWVMLVESLKNQNEEGYWKTHPRSNWLWQDYQIDYGFYDTRFNNDQALLMLKAYQKYGEISFLEASQKHAEWFLSYLDREHIEINISGNSLVGWLIPDYTHKKPHLKTHTSLNHQLAEINYLFELFIVTQDQRYEEAANKLLMGIKNTKELWMKENHDLWYAYYDGKGIKPDYPYLTYNDLFQTQSLLTNLYGKEDQDLRELMESKKKWMDEYRVKGYKE